MSQFTTVSHTGFFSRLKNSFVGLLIGIVLIPISLGLLGWNEHRTVHRSRGLAEAARVVQPVPDVNRVDTELNSQFIHLTGEAVTEERLRDENFNLEKSALRLRRNVKMYQWVEEKQTTSKDKFGGGRETTTTYSYDKKWVNDVIDSSRFHEPSGHQNPNPQFIPKQYEADTIRVGAYELNEALKSAINNWETISLENENLLDSVPAETRERYLVQGNLLYFSSGVPNSESPVVGDLKIEFEQCLPTQVSVVSALDGSRLRPFKTSNGETIQRLFMGNLTATEIMEKLVGENNLMAWLLRGLGFILCFVGFNMILSPISTLFSVIPFLGRLTGGLLFVASGLLAVILSATTIAIAWIVVRPLLGISLLAVAVICIFLLIRIRSSSRANVPPVTAQQP